MESFIRFFNEVGDRYGFSLNIYYSSITDWCVDVGYKATSVHHGEEVIHVSGCDPEYVFALAQVKLKDWLSENKGGY